MTGNPLYFAALTAQNAWSEELKKEFGPAGLERHIRFSWRGKGEAGSELRKRHDAFIRSWQRYDQSRQANPGLMPYDTG